MAKRKMVMAREDLADRLTAAAHTLKIGVSPEVSL